MTQRKISFIVQPLDPDAEDKLEDLKAALVGLLRAYGLSDIITTEIVVEPPDGDQS